MGKGEEFQQGISPSALCRLTPDLWRGNSPNLNWWFILMLCGHHHHNWWVQYVIQAPLKTRKELKHRTLPSASWRRARTAQEVEKLKNLHFLYFRKKFEGFLSWSSLAINSTLHCWKGVKSWFSAGIQELPTYCVFYLFNLHRKTCKAEAFAAVTTKVHHSWVFSIWH